MPRMARVVVPGCPHHITQRGNRRQDVFLADEDRQHFLQLLIGYAVEHPLQILAYCLMTNHVHLVCIPVFVNSLAAALKPVLTQFTQYFNRSFKIQGRLWQGRFFSCPMDELHLWAAIRYVELNPVRASMVTRAEEYPWSSAGAHCGLRSDPLLSPLPEPRPATVTGWSEWLAEGEKDAMLAKLRLHTQTGCPAGDDAFVKRLESQFGRTLRALSVGRPRTKYRKN